MEGPVPLAWQFELQRVDLAKGFHAGQNEIPSPLKFPQHARHTCHNGQVLEAGMDLSDVVRLPVVNREPYDPQCREDVLSRG